MMVTALRNPVCRRGLVMVWAIVILVLLTVLAGAVLSEVNASRRLLDRRQYQLQAEGLAGAGVEGAAARLLEKPDGFADSLELMERSQVRVELKAEPNSPD